MASTCYKILTTFNTNQATKYSEMNYNKPKLIIILINHYCFECKSPIDKVFQISEQLSQTFSQ